MVPIQQGYLPREREIPDTSRGMRKERLLSDHPSSSIRSVITRIQIIEQLIKQQQTYHSRRRRTRNSESLPAVSTLFYRLY
jgi:hypothetical protein